MVVGGVSSGDSDSELTLLARMFMAWHPGLLFITGEKQILMLLTV